MRQHALEGVTVLDLSTEISGSFCTRLLAGLGSKVFKVEPPEGDPSRQLGPFLEETPNGENSALFQLLNAAKESIVLDIRLEQDRAILRDLARGADIIIECFPPDTMDELGLGFTSLSEQNPSLVMTSITDFGQSGPYRDFRGSELVHLALGGMLYTTGQPDREPLMLPGFQASYQAGLNGAVATLTALHHAERKGRRVHVDVSVMESLVSILNATTVTYSHDGVIKGRQGNQHGKTYPMTVRPCKDGYVGLMIASDEDWELFVALAEIDDLADARFATSDQRRALAAEIETILEPWLMARTRRQLFHWAQELRLPFAIVLSPEELRRDPQHRQRRFFGTVEHPTLGAVTTVGAPFRMNDTPWKTERAPLLGEHTSQTMALLQRTKTFESNRVMNEGERAESLSNQVQDDSEPILGGIRILDLTTTWAGPYCTRLLADLGAEVIKIESPTRQDGTRANPGYYDWLNRNKSSLALNLDTPRGKEVFRKLVSVSDVVIENFSPRVMPNFGLNFAELRKIKADLIMLSMPAYGSTGPYRHYVSYGPGIECTAGMTWLTGYEGGPPMLSGSAYNDPVGGLHGAVAVLAALRHQRRTHRGQWIDLSQREALSQMFGETFVAAGGGREYQVRQGNSHPTMCPHGVYRCLGEDRWLAIAVGNEDEWRELCRAMGQDTLANDSRFSTASARRAHREEVDQIIESWTRHQEQHRAMKILQAAGVAAGAVLDGEELTKDEHLAAREFFIRLADQKGQTSQYPGMPWRFDAMHSAFLPAPKLGHDNQKILEKLLGLTKKEMDELEKRGVIGYDL